MQWVQIPPGDHFLVADEEQIQSSIRRAIRGKCSGRKFRPSATIFFSYGALNNGRILHFYAEQKQAVFLSGKVEIEKIRQE